MAWQRLVQVAAALGVAAELQVGAEPPDAQHGLGVARVGVGVVKRLVQASIDAATLFGYVRS